MRNVCYQGKAVRPLTYLLSFCKPGEKMDIKTKLLRIRAILGLSQEALAYELEVSYATVNRWESGKTTPSARYQMLIEMFAQRHNISFDA